MLALLILLGVVFSVSYGSRRITTNATALHKADEMLRTSMVARSQLELAVNLAAVDREQGSNSTTAITFSINEAEQALADYRAQPEAADTDPAEIEQSIQKSLDKLREERRKKTGRANCE